MGISRYDCSRRKIKVWVSCGCSGGKKKSWLTGEWKKCGSCKGRGGHYKEEYADDPVDTRG
ncbi:hypothetical protein HN858_02210 [Candidatus Falkowbacteria bacterium]|nr:hypothetical protein [Candidatus Falkowbacteria bacterium]MBT5502802.1 hypothetical protein [Candidatus Falkowbacteria bacterium]MBT6573427.1 hypothetical protein [Candidatus Falkowbacteria bacterium]MBT7348469.1 hypothetical protein [Candidatus Falkowbacteria bacterium]MBT7501187.1 hypothetical protein [Candidatus Falkowbacteria bacterium]